MGNFYDQQWGEIITGSPFSQKAYAVVGEDTYELSGIFYSGTHGKEVEGRYATEKGVDMQSFQISECTLPDGFTKDAMVKQVIVIDGIRYRITQITGNCSGILNLVLALAK